MPTLRKIPPSKGNKTKKNEEINQKRPLVQKAHCRSVTEKDESSEEDRFSQTPPPIIIHPQKKAKLNSNLASSSTKIHGASSINTNGANTAQFSIASALMNHRARINARSSTNQKVSMTDPKCQHLKSTSTSATTFNNGNHNINSSSSASDIVAVVLSTPMKQTPPPPNMNSHSKFSRPNYYGQQRIHLLIGDRHLQPGQCARVSMNTSSFESGLVRHSHNSVGMASSLLGVVDNTNIIASPVKTSIQSSAVGLQPGDIVRWNRLEVREDYEHALNLETSAVDSVNEAGVGLDQLVTPLKSNCQAIENGSRNGRGPGREISETHTSKNNKHSLLNVVCDLIPSWKDPAAGPPLSRLCRIIPSNNITTTQQTIRTTQKEEFVLEWEAIIPPSMETPKETIMELARWYCSIAQSHLLKSTATFPTQQPCQRRRLCDIASPNILSHIVVKVIRCEKAVSNYSTGIANREGNNVTHATLVDGLESDDILGIGGSINHDGLPLSISSVLLQSMKEGSRILVTHVLSQSVRPTSFGGGASLEGRESLILVPTRETTATLITPDHPYFINQHASPEKEHIFASQPLTVEWASELFSMTQQHSPPKILKDDSIPPSRCRGMMAIVAPLMDIIVDGVDTSLMEGSHWQTPYALSKFLIERPIISTGMAAYKLCPIYRSAMLVLDPKLVSREIVVNIDGDALKILCMDVPAEDMIIDDNDGGRATNLPHPYLPHVGGMLKALCEEHVPLRWVLEQESECNWFVSSVTLLEI